MEQEYIVFLVEPVVSKNETFMDGIEKIREAQNSLFRHANFNQVEYLTYRTNFYNNEPGQTYEPLSLTYQPLTMKETKSKNGQTISFNNIDYKTNWYSNGVCAHALYLTVMHSANDNGLNFSFEYQTGRVTPEKLQYMYYYICKILFEGINNPYKTIEEIIESV